MRQVVHRGAPDPSQRVGRLLLPWLLLSLLAAEEAPPADLARRVAARETESEAARNQYTYRQTVRIDELDSRGVKVGEYSEIRDIVFSPSMERSERPIGKPRLTLVRLKLTDEDFRDLREVQPLLLTADRLPLYETRYRGEESIDGTAYFVLQVRPRQILADQRLFDGLLWIDKRDYSIVRSAGQAVPQVLSTRSENLFPRFTYGGEWSRDTGFPS